METIAQGRASSGPVAPAPPAPLRVLLLTPRLADTASGRLCASLALALDRRRAAPVVCCYAGWGDLARELELAGVEIFFLRRRPGADPTFMFALAAELRRRRIDLVHSLHARKAYVVGVLSGLLAGVRGIASFHDHPAVAEPSLLSRAGRLCGEVVGRVVASSDAVRDSLLRARWIPPGKALVLPDGVDPARFARPGMREAARAHFGVGPDEFLVGGIARPEDEGDAELLREAFALVAEAEPRARLVVSGLAGPGGPRLRFLGPHSDGAGLFAALDHLCLPRADRAVPLALVEALAAGVPVTAGRARRDEGAPPAGPWAFAQLCAAEPRALARGLLALCADPDAARALAEAGRACALRDHSMDEHARRVLALYLGRAGG